MAGHPDYNVTAAYDVTNKTERLTVRQSQATDSSTPIFDMPIVFAFYGANGEHKEVQVHDYLPTQEFDVPLGFQPKWVDFDPDDFIDKTLRFEQPEAALIAAAEEDRSMMSRLWAVQQLGVSRRLDETRVVAVLTRVLNQDAFYGVRATTAKSLGSIGSETAKSGLLAALNQPDSRVRTAVVEALGHFSQEPAVYRAVVHAVQHDESYAVGGAAAEALGSSGIPEVFEVLQRIVISNPEVHLTQAALRGLAATHDARALSILLAAAQPGQPERVRVQALTELAQFPADLDAKQTLELAERVGAALGDPFAQLRQAAVMLAGRLKFAQFCSQIQTAAENAPIPEYQQAAENVSRQLQCPGPGSLNRSSD